MTYKDNFVVEVKADGQILRVKDGSVYLPFGCEYTILLKNLNSKKASVKVSIDNEDVLDGSSLILNPLETHELQGFLRGTTAKNRFRFIQKTKEIQEHRGDKVGDGLVRVEFAFEKPRPQTVVKKIIEEVEHHHHDYFHHHHHHDHPDYWPRKITWYDGSGWDYKTSNAVQADGDQPISTYNMSVGSSGDKSSEQLRGFSIDEVVCDSLGVETSFTTQNTPVADEGITVKGNEIHDQYMYGMIGNLEDSSVIVISLKGMQRSSGVVVNDPVTVQTKLECSTCGLKSKSSFKFCPNCGTFLE